MKTEQFWKLDIDTLKWLYEKNLITATAYLLGIIRGTRGKGWKWTFKAPEFCQEWGISERSFYRAISFLKTHNLIDWRVKGEITIWWNENLPNFDTVSVLPSVAETLPSVAETLPSVAETLPSVAETLPSVAEKTLESIQLQSFQESPRLLTDILIDSSTHSLTNIAPADAAPMPHPKEEREKEFGFQLPREEGTLQASHTLPKTENLQLQSFDNMKVNIPAAVATPIKYDPALGIRPPRQKPKFRYPDGPWLNEAGQINEDFIRDRAALWRTGDTTASKSFGAMAIEDVIGLVAGHYQRLENHAKLETDWTAYVAKNQRYVGNVQQRLNAGIEIPVEEQQKILQKAPALTADSIENAYGNAASPNVWRDREVSQLESVATVPDDIWDAVEAATVQHEQAQLNIPEGAVDVAMYTRTAKSEDVDYYRTMYEKRLATSFDDQSWKPIENTQELESRTKALIIRKGMPTISDEERQRMKEQEKLGRKLAHWNSLLQTGILSVIADVKRQANAQGYEIIDGQIFEVDF